MTTKLPLPSFYNRNKATKHYFPDYARIIRDAESTRTKFNIKPAGSNKSRQTNLIIVDPQETFCMQINGNTELYVADAEQHMANLAEFIMTNANEIDTITVTIDTHYLWQIDMPGFWVDKHGKIVTDNVQITAQQILDGEYAVNPQMALISERQMPYPMLQKYALQYVRDVYDQRGEDHAKWQAHSMIMGPGYTVIPILYEALIYWECLKSSRVYYHIKGLEQLSQRYSPIREQVLRVNGLSVGKIDMEVVTRFTPEGTKEVVNVIGGEASSHCVNWMIRDFYAEIEKVQPGLGASIVVLKDCMGPVIIPGVVDFTFLENELWDFCNQVGIRVYDSTTI